MAAVLDIAKYKEAIKFVARMKKDHGINIPLNIWGKHATGKSQSTEQAATEIGYGCVILNMANQTPEELLGLPEKEIKDGFKSTSYIPPGWFKKFGDKPTIYFLDEFNRGPKYVLQSMFNFINEGRLGPHQLNPHDVVVAACNPDSADYEVTSMEDGALLSRFAQIYLEPSIKEVMSYLAQTKKVHQIALDILRDKGDIVKVSVDEKDKVKVKPDFRMIEKVGVMLNHTTEQEFKDFGLELVGGMIGDELAMIVKTKWDENHNIPEPKDLFEGKVKVKAINVDRQDMIVVLNSRMVDYMIANEFFKKKATKKDKKVLAEYIKHIPKDSAFGMVKELKIKGIGEFDIVDLFDEVDETFLYDLIEVNKQYKG